MGRKYRNLIDKICADENLRLAWRLAAAGKRLTPGVLEFKEFAALNLTILAADMRRGTYQPGPPHQFQIFDPKLRTITALPVRDRIAQHALCNIIEPILDRTLLPRSYACRNGKGTHAAARTLQADMRRLTRHGEPLYALKTDFSRFFASIDRAVLHRMLRAKITCAATRRLIEAMVPPFGIGLPIGSLTSQIFANVYAGAVDRLLQQDLGEVWWYRYMDDIVVLGSDPDHLRRVRDEIVRLSVAQLGLRFSKWSILSVNRGVNFVGYRIWPTHKLLRRTSVVRAWRKLRAFRAGGETEREARFLAAWTGHARWADCQNLFKAMEIVLPGEVAP